MDNYRGGSGQGSIASAAQTGEQRESDIQDGTMPEPPNAATQECVHISQFHSLPQKGMAYMSMLPLSSMSTLDPAAHCSDVKLRLHQSLPVYRRLSTRACSPVPHAHHSSSP